MKQEQATGITEEVFQQELETLNETTHWHNPANVEKYQNFKKQQKERVRAYAEVEQKKLIRENLLLWRKNLPKQWVGATIKNLPPHTLEQTKSIATATPNVPFSAYVTGDTSKEIMRTQYALAEYYIAKGWSKPSSTLVLDESNLVDMAHNGFQGQNDFNDLKLGSKELVVLLNVGDYGNYDTKTSRVAESLIKQVFENDAGFIVGSTIPMNQWVNMILSPGVQKKTQELLQHNVIDVTAPKVGYGASRANDFGNLY